MCEVTVVIPNYNGEKYLLPCLDALFGNTTVEFEVIIIDNGSEDESIAQAREKYSHIEYVLLDKNYGFCRAVNIGIQKSETPYVILLNNDTEIRQGFVEELLKTIKRNAHIFSVESKMIQYHDQSLVDSAGTFYNALGWAFARGKDKPVDKFDYRTRTFAACAGAAIYRKELFSKIGLFDERHFAYLEDIDLGYRARIYGYVNVYEPKAEVIHVGSGSSGSRYNEFKIHYSARNNVYLVFKNMPLLQIVINMPFLLVGFGAKAIFFYRRSLGKQYIRGIKEGLDICRRDSKVAFDMDNFWNYVQIQFELIANIFRKFFS